MHGIVMDIKKNKAVVLQKDGAVIEVSNHNYQIGQKISVNSHPYRKYMLTAACFILCFVTSISGYALYNTPSSYIYVDINPSLRIDINCFERVIDVVPLNDDASELIKSYDFKARDTESCINDIVKACEERKYLNADNNDVELDVVTDKPTLKQRVDSVSTVLKKKNLGVAVLNIDKDENSKAMSVDTSPKRLKAIEKYTQVFGGTVKENATELRGVTTKDIYAQIESLQAPSANASIAPKESVPSAGQNTTPPKKTPASSPKPTAENKNNAQQNIDEKPSETAPAQKQETTKDEVDLNSSPKRLEAIEEYTKAFGGSMEENTAILRGKTVKEIKAEIEKQTQKEIADKKPAPSEKPKKKEPSTRKNKNSTPSVNSDTKQQNEEIKSETPIETEKSH